MKKYVIPTTSAMNVRTEIVCTSETNPDKKFPSMGMPNPVSKRSVPINIKH